jgi:two-component system, LytTR family, sensor kinase
MNLMGKATPSAARTWLFAAFLTHLPRTELRFRNMEAGSGKFESPRWYWIFAVWFGIGLFDATQTVFVMRAEGMHHYWTRLYFTLLLSWLPFMIATPFILRLGRKFPLTGNRAMNWTVHLGVCAIICLTYSLWISMWEESLNPWAFVPGPDPFSTLLLRKFFSSILSTTILYGLVLLVGHILAAQKQVALQQAETARLSEQLAKAQLNALRRQIEPHFLFNTLNAVAGLVREQRNEAAVTMIARLSEFLRRTVSDSDRQQVALGEELDFAEKYLEIQKVRFADRLSFAVDVPADLLSARVPSLILQPMVENAIKHGIAKRVQGGAISIDAIRSNGTLTLRIFNEGPSLPAGWEKTTPGIGVQNVRTRLQSLYGSGFELNLHNVREGVEASLSLPYVDLRPDTSIKPSVPATES